ncbi:PIG-L family deacetylase [Pseudobacteriovorax antillogorgiicola]|uniref:GlcNAc-PI de-N-acetylase n=1 Tax=Pseudobacteriovorax antillogorgiicola TaxID=1513793 RepID=A0A1Y6CN90_9BACT|nr:PIG-L family deacetylase [Pseudobacteriovorax antillogorgiicola]TCS44573.1 GlcNAc-PI de-N-acetylase [Pseudobacteriovorax antillogorgiicola]SMF77933.1 GlcNAc-PI de-N-acetylase [Pseudobacteriovorax antillogorgiicola]
MSRPSHHEYNLIVAAHPDDETLFFSSILMQEARETRVLCVTDGNADGQGSVRKKQFTSAMASFGIHHGKFGTLPDIYEKRLSYDEVSEMLEDLPTPTRVYTHGPVGEYMHPHHQDVCYAVTRFFRGVCPVFGVAYNCFPDEHHHLSRAQFELKAKVIAETYGSETNRFLNLIPCTAVEGFVELSYSEVREIYKLLSGQSQSMDESQLKHFLWLKKFLIHRASLSGERLF